MNINDMSTEQLQFITQYVPKNVVFLRMAFCRHSTVYCTWGCIVVAPVGRPVLVYDNICAVFSLFICVVSTVYAVCVIVYYNLFDWNDLIVSVISL